MRILFLLLCDGLLLEACTSTQHHSRTVTVERPAPEEKPAPPQTQAAAPEAPAARPRVPHAELVQQVKEREQAFAKTMADRDLKAFRTFLSNDAIFFSGSEPLRGPAAVVDRWSRYFEGDEAPFSWAPELVEVSESGTLALSSGPVYGTSGELIGRFNSVWRLEEPGIWRIVFDKGEKVCAY